MVSGPLNAGGSPGGACPFWVSADILSASERIGDERVVLWFGEN